MKTYRTVTKAGLAICDDFIREVQRNNMEGMLGKVYRHYIIGESLKPQPRRKVIEYAELKKQVTNSALLAKNMYESKIQSIDKLFYFTCPASHNFIVFIQGCNQKYHGYVNVTPHFAVDTVDELKDRGRE